MKQFSHAGFILYDKLSSDNLDNKELYFYFNSLFSFFCERLNAISNSDMDKRIKSLLIRDILIHELDHISDLINTDISIKLDITEKDISDFHLTVSYLECVLDTKYKRSLALIHA